VSGDTVLEVSSLFSDTDLIEIEGDSFNQNSEQQLLNLFLKDLTDPSQTELCLL